MVLGLLLTALLCLHEIIPSRRGLGFLIESFLPWTWVLLVCLLLLMFIRFSVLSLIGVLVPAIVWTFMFGAYLMPAGDAEDADLSIVTQNIGARLPEPTATAQALLASDPDIVTVQELESVSGEIVEQTLDDSFDHEQVVDTIGVWSKYPMSEPVEVDLGLQWPRAFRTTIETDHGPLDFYAVHLPSVRPGEESLRNAALTTLTSEIKGNDAAHVVMAGDFNSTASDRYFDGLNEEMTDTRRAVGGGFGFTWPSKFPLVRLDHVLVRGMDPVSDEVLDRGTSDHRAVNVGLDF